VVQVRTSDINYYVSESVEFEERFSILPIPPLIGSWVMDMGKSYRNSEFHGIDVVPVFPADPKLPNVIFQQGNIIDGIPYRDGTFDYVILRRLCLSLKAERWPALLDEMFRVAGKGGYVELVEINPFYCPILSDLSTFLIATVNEICASRGTDPNISTNLKVFLREAGFVNIQHGFVSIPVGNWGDNKIGGMMGRNYREALAAVSPFMAPQLGKTPKQYDEYLDTCLAECNEFQAYSNAYWAYAQRPM
ncbi:hypothetical protein BC936DRAFT_141975, partial [Jimgerdemannia flammicorona]